MAKIANNGNHIDRFKYKSTDQSINVLLVSHGNRIQCYIQQLLLLAKKTTGFEIYDDIATKIKQIRINNLSLFELRITPDIIELCMVYSGIDPFGKTSSEFNDLFPKSKLSFRNDVYFCKQEIVFYIFRHAEAEHNDKSIINRARAHMSYDTQLTESGRDQVKRLSTKLPYLNITNIQYVMASDLVRTRQTAALLMKEIQKFTNVPRKIYVLPCSHELSEGTCDGSNNIDPVNQVSSTQFKEKTLEDFEIDKTAYNFFYSEGARSYFNKKREHCKNTNMISNKMNIASPLACASSSATLRMSLSFVTFAVRTMFEIHTFRGRPAFIH